jgi:bacterioferritin
MSPQIDQSERVLAVLNEALTAELTALHQYLLHAKLCQNWGYSRLAEYNRKESVEEMAHAELLMDRILFLNGMPNMADLLEIRHCENVREQLECDLALEREAVSRLNAAIKTAVEAGDHATRQLFDKILLDEDRHVEHLESQLHVINEIGVERYLARQIQ